LLKIVVLATTGGAMGTLVAAAFEAGPATSIAPARTERAADVAPTRLRPRMDRLVAARSTGPPQARATNTATVSSSRT
jgi:hypothetical protein